MKKAPLPPPSSSSPPRKDLHHPSNCPLSTLAPPPQQVAPRNSQSRATSEPTSPHIDEFNAALRSAKNKLVVVKYTQSILAWRSPAAHAATSTSSSSWVTSPTRPMSFANVKASTRSPILHSTRAGGLWGEH